MIRRTEEGQNRRRKEIESIKQNRQWVSNVAALKATPGWEAFREILQQSIQTQQKMIDAWIIEDNPPSWHPSRAFKMVKTYAEYLRDLVENPQEILAGFDQKIESIKNEIEEAREELA